MSCYVTVSCVLYKLRAVGWVVMGDRVAVLCMSAVVASVSTVHPYCAIQIWIGCSTSTHAAMRHVPCSPDHGVPWR